MSIFDLAGSDTVISEARCSRKGCRSAASWQLLWNNPKIHSPERRKVWLACEEHRTWLEEYLQTRGLWKQTVEFGEPPAGPGDLPAGREY